MKLFSSSLIRLLNKLERLSVTDIFLERMCLLVEFSLLTKYLTSLKKLARTNTSVVINELAQPVLCIYLYLVMYIIQLTKTQVLAHLLALSIIT
jgi:hypothetical protein